MTTLAPDAPPRLREDLVVSRQDTPEGVRFVVKDPRNGAFFRVREAEHAILRRLDGATPIDAVATGVSSELGVEATAEDVAPFVAQLQRRGLLESEAAPSAGGRRPLVSGSPLWLRVAAFDPDRILDRLLRPAGFVFHPWFLGGTVALVLWAVAATAAHAGAIADDLATLWTLGSLATAWATVFAVTALHEFAHGLACKRFGGQVHEMGFLLVYFQPAFYCDVSDAYLFPKRSQRLWVTAAGAWCDLVTWGLATLLWRLCERGTWPSSLALVVMATCGVRTFFNLNPLIRLDGYYLLTDLLQVANLRPRAFAWLGSRVARLWGGGREVPEPSPRERRIFLAYGLLAAGFSYWLLTGVLLAMGEWLTWNYQGWGFAVVALLAAATFLPRPALPPRGRLALLLAGATGGLAVFPMPLRVSGDAELLPRENADVRAALAGVLAEVFVDEGQAVEAGAPVARVCDPDLEARLAMARAELAEQEAGLALLLAGARPGEREIARIEVRKAEARRARGEAELLRTRSLADKGLESRAALQEAECEAALLAREVEGAEARRRDLEAGARPEEVAALRSRVERCRAEAARLEAEIARSVVRAPHAGVVTTPRVRERVGESLQRGDLVAEVHEVRTLRAEVAVPEREIGPVRPGMPVSLRFRSCPERTFRGTVAAVAPAALDAGHRGGRIVRVAVEVRNPGGRLRPSETGFASIECGESTALDVLTARVRGYARLELWSWW